MKTYLTAFFVFVLLCMLAVTSWASFHEGVFDGGAQLFREPWGIATLADTYFAFFTFYLWVLHKESSWAKRLAWLVGIVMLGNIAMATYALIQIRRAKSDTFEGIFA